MRNVSELNEYELEELRDNYYQEHLDDGSLEEIFGFDVSSPEFIPIDVVKVYYSDVTFTEDDFFCNINSLPITVCI